MIIFTQVTCSISNSFILLSSSYGQSCSHSTISPSCPEYSHTINQFCSVLPPSKHHDYLIAQHLFFNVYVTVFKKMNWKFFWLIHYSHHILLNLYFLKMDQEIHNMYTSMISRISYHCARIASSQNASLHCQYFNVKFDKVKITKKKCSCGFRHRSLIRNSISINNKNTY